jgi:hypothetical protein
MIKGLDKARKNCGALDPYNHRKLAVDIPEFWEAGRTRADVTQRVHAPAGEEIVAAELE